MECAIVQDEDWGRLDSSASPEGNWYTEDDFKWPTPPSQNKYRYIIKRVRKLIASVAEQSPIQPDRFRVKYRKVSPIHNADRRGLGYIEEDKVFDCTITYLATCHSELALLHHGH
jgi:hypothetical protein